MPTPPSRLARIEMKRFVLLSFALAFLGCAMTQNVNTRKAGQPWNYYGDLVSLYRDETQETPVALVWLGEVVFLRVNRSEFQKSIQTYLHQGYRKIGFVSVRSQYFVDPYEVKKLAADKGARLVVGCWFNAHKTGSNVWMVDYWYQLLDKSGTAPVAVPPPSVPVPTPTREHRSGYLE
jgi:hypothetical protein